MSNREYNFGLFSEEHYPETYAKTALKGIIEPDLLSTLFFSRKNMTIIQNKVRRDIYDRTQGKYLIDNQPETEILIIMRSVFLTYSKNRSEDITEQIKVLNEISYRKIVEKIYPTLVGYMKYLRDANEPYRLLEKPEADTIRGTGNKQLVLEDKLFF